jgi:hypothetical protein
MLDGKHEHLQIMYSYYMFLSCTKVASPRSHSKCDMYTITVSYIYWLIIVSLDQPATPNRGLDVMLTGKHDHLQIMYLY